MKLTLFWIVSVALIATTGNDKSSQQVCVALFPSVFFIISVVARVNYNEILRVSPKRRGTCFSNRRCGNVNRFVRAIGAQQSAESTTPNDPIANTNIHTCCQNNRQSIILRRKQGASQSHPSFVTSSVLV